MQITCRNSNQVDGTYLELLSKPFFVLIKLSGDENKQMNQSEGFNFITPQILLNKVKKKKTV